MFKIAGSVLVCLLIATGLAENGSLVQGMERSSRLQATGPEAVALVSPCVQVGSEEPLPPWPVAPGDGDTVNSIIPTLTVMGSAPVALYQFRVYEGSSIAAEGLSLFPSWNVALGGRPLQRGHDYTWTCRMQDHRGWSPWFSPSWSFRVDAPSSPPEPKLPSDGATVYLNRPVLVVKPLGLEARYRFRVYSGRTLVAEGTSDLPFWQVGEPLAPGGPYEWTCRAEFAGDTTSWFQPRWRFEVREAPGRDAVAAVPGAVTGRVVASPNPFRDRVRFGSDGTGPVRVELYAADGRLVYADEQVGAGARLVWDGRDANGRPAAPGVYFGRVISESGVESLRVTKAR